MNSKTGNVNVLLKLMFLQTVVHLSYNKLFPMRIVELEQILPLQSSSQSGSLTLRPSVIVWKIEIFNWIKCFWPCSQRSLFVVRHVCELRTARPVKTEQSDWLCVLHASLAIFQNVTADFPLLIFTQLFNKIRGQSRPTLQTIIIHIKKNMSGFIVM